MLSMINRGRLDEATQGEFEHLISRLRGFLSQSFDEDGQLIVADPQFAIVPVGGIVPFAGTTEPAGYLLCNGRPMSRVSYKSLFDIIGTTYGTGDGSTTFNLPDLRQRFPLGRGVTGTGSVLGVTGGAIDHTHGGGSHTHTVPSHSHGLPTHTHTVPGHTHPIPDHTHSVDGGTSGDGSHNHGGSSTNSAGAHSHTGTTEPGSVAASTTLGGTITASTQDHVHDFTTSTAADHEHSLTIQSDGDHSHSVSGVANASGAGNTQANADSTTGATGGTSDAGGGGTTGAASGQSDPNNPPFLTINYLIYSGVWDDTVQGMRRFRTHPIPR